jgi:hypothetical protein
MRFALLAALAGSSAACIGEGSQAPPTQPPSARSATSLNVAEVAREPEGNLGESPPLDSFPTTPPAADQAQDNDGPGRSDPHRTVVSIPAGAEVLDAEGILLGETPLELSAHEPPRQIVLRLSGYFDAPLRIDDRTPLVVEARMRRDPNASFWRRPRASRRHVTLVSIPLGAEVWTVEGRSIGRAPIDVDRTELPMRLVLRSTNHRDTEVQLEASSPDRLEVRLRPLIIDPYEVVCF